MMDPSPEVYRAIKGLRVVRRYRPDAVSADHLDRILEAGRWTGSSKNRQDWRFVVVRDPEQIERLAECGDFTDPMRNAPLTIAPVGLPTAYEWDLGRASQNMMLAAASLGVGSCPQTMHRHDDARAVLGVPPDHWCWIAISFGYPDLEAERQARQRTPMSGRVPLAELVDQERFSA